MSAATSPISSTVFRTATMKYYLAGDIGGTNSRFSLYGVETANIRPLHNGERSPGSLIFRKVYPNDDFVHFEDAVKAFQVEPELSGITIDCACFAVAGPVKLNSVTMTNKGHWTIQGEEVASKCGMKCVQIVNDFVGAGYGLLTLDVAKDCVTIQAGDERIPSAPIACLGAGTGLGECFITPSGDEPADGGEYQYQCFPSEGGHVEFAPRNEEEFALLSYLTSLYPARVSVERIVSGQGICDVYDFYANVRHPEKKRANEALHASIAAGKEAKSGLIANNAGSDELCMMAMTMFATAYGTEAGNVCLKFMPFGGLFLAGGITPKNLDLVRNPSGPFLAAFHHKGRVSGFLKSVPVYAVMVDDVGERGAQFVAFRNLVRIQQHQSV